MNGRNTQGLLIDGWSNPFTIQLFLKLLVYTGNSHDTVYTKEKASVNISRSSENKSFLDEVLQVLQPHQIFLVVFSKHVFLQEIGCARLDSPDLKILVKSLLQIFIQITIKENGAEIFRKYRKHFMKKIR